MEDRKGRNPFIWPTHWLQSMSEGEADRFRRRLVLGFYALLLIAGLTIYWAWGIMYGTWYPFDRGNIGIYTIYAPLIAFGIIGIILYSRKPAPS